MTDENKNTKDEAAIAAPQGKAAKKATVADLQAEILELRADNESAKARIEKLERKQKVTTDGYTFAANQLRPLYGFGAVAAVFDAIAEKLAE